MSIAAIAGGLVALSGPGLRWWPSLSVIMLWPALGGHWVELLFLNGLRPRLPANRLLHGLVRLAVWFAGGILLAMGVALTARFVLPTARLDWLTWATAGAAFVAIELVAHAGLHARGRPSFYNGLGYTASQRDSHHG
jgi:hypothetical protein